MNLTEPQAGSDLGALTTRAEPDGDGGWRLTGQKIFITWGDHDCADNIVHLVLARLPDAPPGTRGISLFLAPKQLVGDDGALGEPNDLAPARIEHKLGIHASPTCVMLFEGAKAELVGAPNQGLAAHVRDDERRPAAGRRPGRGHRRARLSAGAGLRAGAQAGPLGLDRRLPPRLFDHPDVRRTLMLMKAKIEAARAICLATAVAADLARTAANPADRDAAQLRQELLTPIAKAWSTDMGVEAASAALQVHGGMGFIEETGAAQYYRDARILPIYEGTNGIHAIDLMGRKLAWARARRCASWSTTSAPPPPALKSADDAWLHTSARGWKRAWRRCSRPPAG